MAGNIYDDLIKEQMTTTGAALAESANHYDNLIKFDLAQSRQQLNTTLMSTVGGNPDQAAKAVRLSRSIGVPSDTVERNMPDAEKLARMREVEIAIEQDPVLRQQFKDPEFAKLAHDQSGNLGVISRFARNLAAGWVWQHHRVRRRLGLARSQMRLSNL